MKAYDGSVIINKISEFLLKLHFEPQSLAGKSFLMPDMEGIEAQLSAILDENIKIAAAEKRPLCQDCGMVQIFVQKGKFATFSGAANIYSLIEEGVRRAYTDTSLRKSMVTHPFERKNTGDNTPAVIHIEETDGAGLAIKAVIKGGGSENVSAMKMLFPSAGRQGAADFVIETLKKAGGAGCPPYFVGVGVGGSFDSVCLTAKKALLEQSREDSELNDIITSKLASLDFGTLGFPGKYPVKDIFIKTAPTHIAMLPVAVALNCHSFRCGEIIF